MGDRLHRRPRSPPLHNPGRSSMPTFPYPSYADPYGDSYTLPPRRESAVDPRNPAAVVTTYKVKPEYTSASRDGSRHRRLTLDGTSRPNIINATPRSPAIHDGSGRPQSPLNDPHRSSGEGGEFYSIPASSGRHRSHRHDYGRTMDDADVSQRGMLVIGSGRQSARYPGRSRQGYPGTLVRRGDSVAEDYGDDGYGYTNPRDLVQYDLDQSARYPSRRDSYEGSRPARPTSISGYADLPPRSYDNRERGPPPTTRGLDRISNRAPQYETPPVRASQGEAGLRSPRREQFYEVNAPREHRSRRPVIYHDRPRDDRYYDPRDEDLRDMREIPHRSRRYDDEIDQRGSATRPERTEPNEYEKRREPSKKKEYERDGDYEAYDDRAERRGGREKGGSNGKDIDKKDDSDDHKERKRTKEKLATGISLAAAALGIDTLAKNVKHEDNDDDRDHKEESRRRRDDDSHRNRRDNRDDKEIIDLSGRDPQERHVHLDEKEPLADQRSDQRDRTPPKDDLPPVDLSGRNPQEKKVPHDMRNEADESKESRKEKAENVNSDTIKHTKGSSPLTEEDSGQRRPRRRHGSAAAFNPKDALDLRALKDALNNRDSSSPVPPSREPAREGSFERERPKEPSNVPADSAVREDRGRRDQGESEDERPPHLRVVSPPRDIKKLDENKPKGILRQPRERFPEDPVAIREGVAPLKDAKKDGIPPDARWTKISRRMVNPDALDAGKERYEAREDFVIVLRVLTKEEIQAYAIATQQIRAAREQIEDIEEREKREERHRRRRERHDRHKRERERGERERLPHREDGHDHDQRRQKKEKDSHSESDSTPDDEPSPKLIEGHKQRKLTFDTPAPAVPAAPIVLKTAADSSLREDPARPGTYTGYMRNPPKR